MHGPNQVRALDQESHPHLSDAGPMLYPRAYWPGLVCLVLCHVYPLFKPTGKGRDTMSRTDCEICTVAHAQASAVTHVGGTIPSPLAPKITQMRCTNFITTSRDCPQSADTQSTQLLDAGQASHAAAHTFSADSLLLPSMTPILPGPLLAPTASICKCCQPETQAAAKSRCRAWQGLGHCSGSFPNGSAYE